MNLKAKIVAGALFGLFIGSLFIDAHITTFIDENRIGLLDNIMFLVTDLGLFLILSIISTYLILTKRYGELILVVIASLLSLETSYILKKVFQIPRPELAQLTHATGYTFPSIHAAVGLSLLPFAKRIFQKKWVAHSAAIILLTIAISRMYLGVHYLSDIIFGGLIGYLFAWILISLEEKYQISERFMYHLVSKREVRRQVAHMATGLMIIILFKLKIMNIFMLGGIALFGGLLSLISRKKRIPIIHTILDVFERPEEMKKFPGKGSFFLVVGSLLALILFEEPIAFAAIAIMAVGDSITALTGIYFGKIKSPLNPNKHLEGTILAIIVGTIAAFTFVPLEKAFLASIVAMTFEALTLEHIDRVLDDNVLIPLIAGGIMTLMI